MGETDDALQPSKKRAAGRELSRDNPGLDDDEDSGEQETGTFKKASDEVLAARRIVKVRRNQSASATSSNPFAGISLTAPTIPAAIGAPAGADKEPSPEAKLADVEKSEDDLENKNNEPVAEVSVEEKDNTSLQTKPQEDTEDTVEKGKMGNDDKKDASEDKKDEDDHQFNENSENATFSSFQQLSSNQNAFTSLTGTGFSTSTFSFGSIPINGSSSGTSSFSFGSSTNGSSSLFNTVGPAVVSNSEKTSFPAMQEVTVETGEENEKAVFSTDSVLFEYIDGGWKERGKGGLKLNISATGNGKARLLMRARGNYRLILNASLYPDMKLTNMEKKGITFACVNSTSENKDGDGLSTFALKFKDPSIVDEFRAAIMAHKGGNTATTLRTPENSPKATDD